MTRRVDSQAPSTGSAAQSKEANLKANVKAPAGEYLGPHGGHVGGVAHGGHGTAYAYAMNHVHVGSAAQIVDAVVTAVSVALGIFVLSLLDKYPMPLHNLPFLNHLNCDDLKFYSPPHAAIAFVFFNSPSMPALRQWGVGILASAVTAIAVVEVSTEFDLDPVMVRCVAVGLAVTIMKLLGAIFPPAAAVAVLFVDNAVMKGHGRLYALMPGLSGTAVLFVLAFVKLELMQLVKGKAKSV